MKTLKPLYPALVSTLLLCSFAQAQVIQQNQSDGAGKKLSPVMAQMGQALVLIKESINASNLGNEATREGDWNLAINRYQKAVALWQDNAKADYGLARCYHETGEGDKEIQAYWAAIRSDNPAGDGFRETDTTKLLTFALLLDKSGQTTEAVTVYNHAAMLLRYMENKPSYGYLLPLFGTEQGQIAYTPARLQALAQVGLGVDSLYTQELKPAERLTHLREAARLYPASPVVQSYLGDVLAGAGDAVGAKAARVRANALGLSRVTALLDAQTAIMQEQKGVK